MKGGLCSWLPASLFEFRQGRADYAASALFLLRYGVNFLPYLYLFFGALTFITALSYSAAPGRLDSRKFFLQLIAVLMGLLLLERIAILFPYKSELSSRVGDPPHR